MKRCIWYVSKYVSPPDRASAGGRGYLLMRQFARLGYTSLIITSDSNQLADVPRLDKPFLLLNKDGMQVCWVRTFKYLVAKSARRIVSWLHFEWRLFRLPFARLPRPDAVIVSSLSLLTVLNGLWWRKKFECRLIFEVRDIWPLTITEEGGFSRWNPLVLALGLVEKLGYRYADEIVGTMPNLGEHVQAVLGYSRPVKCIPMGVEEGLLTDGEPLPDDFSANYLPSGKFIVAHVGAMGISNALDTFFECADRMKGDANIHFLVVGDGDLRASYEADYGHLPNLTIAPRVAKSVVQSVLSTCDLLYFSVHTSAVWKFGQSLNKVIDYMLAGKPIVASYSGFPSMINEAQCGSYVPAGDVDALREEIVRYASMDSQQLVATGQRGKTWLLENRRYDVLADAYLKILLPDKAGSEQV